VWNGSIHHGPEVKSVYHGPATVSTEKLNGVGVCGRSMAQKLIMGGPREREREGLLVLTKGETCQRDEGDGLAAAAGDS
jgi:hypothetical protein